MVSEKKYRIRMAVALTALLIGVIFAMSAQASAADAVADASSIEEFADLTGDASYIVYADNYYLDMEETDWLETGPWLLNCIANMIFGVIRWFAKVVVTLYYHCMAFDMAEMFHDEINEIQEALNSGIFEPMFLLAFCGSALILLKKMLRRDLMGAYGEIAKVVGIVVLSVLIVNESANVLSAATDVTKEVSTQALVGMQGEEVSSTTSFAAQSAGVLWVNLIHQPWVFIEFGDDIIDNTTIIDDILTLAPDDDARETVIEEYVMGTAFSKDRAGEKISFMFLYIFPFLIKGVIYIILALLTLVLQLLAVFYVVIAPIVLILAMIPGFEGIISSWLQKMFESQLSILLMSFITGLLVKVDAMLFDACADEWGWLVVMIVQVVLSIGVIVYRDKLLSALTGRNISTKQQKGNKKNMKEDSSGEKQGRRRKKTESLEERGITSTGRSGNRHTNDNVQERASSTGRNRVRESSVGYRVESGRAKVERPVMSASMPRKKAAGGENMSVQSVPARSCSVKTQEAQTRLARPRMDQSGIKNNIVKFEPNRAVSRPAVNGGGGNVTRPVMGKPTQGVAGAQSSKSTEKGKGNKQIQKPVQRPGTTKAVQKAEGASSRQRKAAKMRK